MQRAAVLGQHACRCTVAAPRTPKALPTRDFWHQAPTTAGGISEPGAIIGKQAIAGLALDAAAGTAVRALLGCVVAERLQLLLLMVLVGLLRLHQAGHAVHQALLLLLLLLAPVHGQQQVVWLIGAG